MAIHSKKVHLRLFLTREIASEVVVRAKQYRAESEVEVDGKMIRDYIHGTFPEYFVKENLGNLQLFLNVHATLTSQPLHPSPLILTQHP